MLILERMNKIYTKNGDRIYDPTDWIHYFYQPANQWRGSQDFRNYPAIYWEHIRELSFNYDKEDDFNKRAYSIYSEEKNFSGVKEKDPFLVYDDEKLQGITIHKTDRVKYYVSADLYLNKDNNFFKNLKNAKYVKRDADTEFPNRYPSDNNKRGHYEKYIYEVLSHNTTTVIQPSKEDFILTTYRPHFPDNYRYFDFQSEKYYWKDSTWSDKLKKLIFTEGRRIVLRRYNTIKLKPDDFISPPEKEILSLMTPTFLKGLNDIKDNQSIQSSFFLYDRSSVIKKTFVSELDDFLPIMCSFGYFGTKHNIQNIDLISTKNAQKFYIEKDAIKERLDFQLKHVSGTELVTDDNKVHELLFKKLSKTKKTMNVLDFLIIRGQQVFEEGGHINPIEIKIEDNRVQFFFDKYKDNKVKFKLIGLLIASSVGNDTEKMFLQTTSIGRKICAFKRQL